MRYGFCKSSLYLTHRFRMFAKLLICIFLLSAFHSASAQNAEDSLIRVLEQTAQDTNYVNLANQIANKLRDNDPEKSISYSQKAIETAEKIGFEKGIAVAKVAMGWSYYRLSEIDKAFKTSQEALALIEKIQNLPLKAEVLTNIAAVYNEQGRFEASLDYFNQSLEINQKLNNFMGVGRCLNNLAFNSYKLKNYAKSLEYAEKSIAHIKKYKLTPYYLAFAMRTKADVLYDQNRLDEAIESWQEALKIAEKTQNNTFIVPCLNRIAKAYLKKKQYPQCLEILDRSIQIAKKYKLRADISYTYSLYSQVYEAQKQYDKAFEFHKQFFATHDSIFDETNTKKINQLQAHFESEQKEKEILLLKTQQTQDQLLYEKKHAQQQWIIFSILSALLFLGLIAFLIFRSRHNIQQAYGKLAEANLQIVEKSEEINQQKEEILQTLQVVNEQKDLIEKKNTDITASITYALRIQKAILPRESDLKKHFDCFVFFRPRDIVSGDFYWFAEKNNHKILALADCTGHGVSGAFMTMIGNNILNQIVHDMKISEPNRILDLMNPLLEKTLLHSEGTIKDGMDISIIALENLAGFQNPQGTKISYAGAMNPLYYIQNQELIEIKADKTPIGGQIKEGFAYQKHEFLPNVTDWKNPQGLTIYLCSDGFQDQFGGHSNKKFMVGNFKKLLLEISPKPLKEQKQQIEAVFNTWQGNQKQTDDVTVLGIRL